MITRAASPPLPLSICFAYSLPVLGTTFLVLPAFAVLQGIYAKHFGLQLTVLGGLFLVARLFDAVSDPVVGYLCDRARAAGGSRRPWVLAGGMLMPVCAHFLFVPPPGVSERYFLGWFIAFFLAWTLFQVPHLAWGSELTREPRSRTRLFGWYSFVSTLGSTAFYAVPMLPVFESSELTPRTLEVVVLAGAFYLTVALCCSLRITPGGEFVAPSRPVSPLRTLRSVLANRPFLVFASAYVFSGIGSGMLVGLMFVVLDSYFGLGEHIALILACATGASTASTLMWSAVAGRLGKRTSWILGQILFVLSVAACALVDPGPTSLLPMLCISVGIYVAFGAPVVLSPALLADIADYDTCINQTRYAGSYFAAYTLLLKTVTAVGSGLGLLIAGSVGFDPVAPGGGDNARTAVMIAFISIPIVTTVVSLYFIARLPLTPRRMETVRRRVQQMQSRAAGSPTGMPPTAVESPDETLARRSAR